MKGKHLSTPLVFAVLIALASLLALVAITHKSPKKSVLSGTVPCVPTAASPSAPASSAIQEKEAFDRQVAADREAQKKKQDAIDKLDNKHPKPITSSDDQAVLSTLFSQTTSAQKQLADARAKAQAFLAQPTAEANARAGELLDVLKEFQKSHHAEGCDLTPPRMEKRKQLGLQWDCSHAAEIVAQEAQMSGSK